MPKRLGHILEKVADFNNIELADINARKGKHNPGIIKHDQNREVENIELSLDLMNGNFHTSAYKNKIIHEPKERLLYILPYFPDRVVHHAIMQVMEEQWIKIMISTTYACIRGRGIGKLYTDLKKALRNDSEGTKYCLKMDIHHFYPSINHKKLEKIIRKKLKDPLFLELLDEIIESADGVPIGNYLSQFFANLYLTYFDHWIKETLHVKYYFRYCDDMVILCNSKEELAELRVKIQDYLRNELDLELKKNWQIFPVEDRGIDYCGFVFKYNHILIRSSIKRRIMGTVKRYMNHTISQETFDMKMTAYYGWMKRTNSKNLAYTIEKVTGKVYNVWYGRYIRVSRLFDINAIIYIKSITERSKYYEVNFIMDNHAYFTRTNNKKLIKLMYQYLENEKSQRNKIRK